MPILSSLRFDTTIIQNEIDVFQISSYFTATPKSHSVPSTQIPFDVLLDHNSGINNPEPGIVTIMDEGIYYFSVNVQRSASANTQISITHNEKRVCIAHNCDGASNHYMMTCSASIKAAKGDKVSVTLDSGSIDGFGSFVGFLTSLE